MAPTLIQFQQRWNLTPAGGGMCRLTNALGSVLQATAEGNINAAPEVKPESSEFNLQLWKIDELADGSFRIKPKTRAQALTAGRNNTLVLQEWEPDNLKAEGLIGGKVVAMHTVRAPGTPATLRLVADTAGRELLADDNDWIRVYAYVCDARGTMHPYANDEITFTVEGEGRIINDARIKANPVRAETGIATVLLRSTSHAGPITVRASAFGLKSAEVTLHSK